jgi:hypothetical protein
LNLPTSIQTTVYFRKTTCAAEDLTDCIEYRTRCVANFILNDCVSSGDTIPKRNSREGRRRCGQ